MKKELAIKALVLFLFIYDISFLAIPSSFTTGRLAFLFLLTVAVTKKYKFFDKKSLNFLVVVGFLFVYSLIQFFLSNDFIQSSRLLWFSLYSIIVPFITVQYFKELKLFLICVLIAVTFQSVLTLASFFNPQFKLFILSLIEVGGNDIAETVYRATGFTSNSGSSFSILQYIGVCSGLLLLDNYKFSFYKVFIISLSILICFISIIFVGRLGLVLSTITFLIFFLKSISFKKGIMLMLLIFILTRIDFTSFLKENTSEISNFSIDFFSEWVSEAFEVKNNATSNALKEMPIPPLSIETVIGTGKVFDSASASNSSGNDSGYIQTYYSLGFVAALIFYTGYLIYLFKMTRNVNNKSILWFFVVIIFAIENKEPFVFKYILPFFLLTIILFSAKCEFLKKKKLYEY